MTAGSEQWAAASWRGVTEPHSVAPTSAPARSRTSNTAGPALSLAARCSGVSRLPSGAFAGTPAASNADSVSGDRFASTARYSAVSPYRSLRRDGRPTRVRPANAARLTAARSPVFPALAAARPTTDSSSPSGTLIADSGGSVRVSGRDSAPAARAGARSGARRGARHPSRRRPERNRRRGGGGAP